MSFHLPTMMALRKALEHLKKHKVTVEDPGDKIGPEAPGSPNIGSGPTTLTATVGTPSKPNSSACHAVVPVVSRNGLGAAVRAVGPSLEAVHHIEGDREREPAGGTARFLMTSVPKTAWRTACEWTGSRQVGGSTRHFHPFLAP